ncbi:hypothetical protein YC2023_082838 [Brassica napus]
MACWSRHANKAKSTVKILPLNDLKYSSSAWLQHLEKINILPPKHFSDSPKRLCIVSQNHKLESFLHFLSRTHPLFSSISPPSCLPGFDLGVFGFRFVLTIFYRRILLPLTAVTPHFLASPSDLLSPPLVTEKQQFLERFDFTNSSSQETAC